MFFLKIFAVVYFLFKVYFYWFLVVVFIIFFCFFIMLLMTIIEDLFLNSEIYVRIFYTFYKSIVSSFRWLHFFLLIYAVFITFFCYSLSLYLDNLRLEYNLILTEIEQQKEEIKEFKVVQQQNQGKRFLEFIEQIMVDFVTRQVLISAVYICIKFFVGYVG